jgi:hypothetical protein
MFIVYLAIFVPLIALVADAIGDSQTIFSHIHISSKLFMYIGWFVVAFLNFVRHKDFEAKGYRLGFLAIFSLSSILTIFLSVWDYVTPPNFVYAITKLQQQQWGVICVYLLGIVLLTRSLMWWKKHYRIVLLLTPFIAIAWLIVVRLWPFNYFLEMVKEDHLIENLQVIVLLIGATIVISKAVTLAKLGNHYLGLLFIFTAACLFFVAGDEVSWGQRIFGIQTPEYWSQLNSQKETTLHNLYSVQWMVEKAYLIIGILGGTLWLIPKRLTSHIPYHLLIPPYYLFGFFLIPGIYYAYPLYSGENQIKAWAEVTELLLYGGIVAYAIYVVRNLSHSLFKH